MIIPIVFSTDDNYVLPMLVAVQSLINTKSRQDDYKIYVFHSGLTQENLELIHGFSNKVEINDVNVGDYVEKLGLYSKGRYTVAMYYRIFIPEILGQYEKVLYLDCDVIVHKDVATLFNTPLGENCLGASNVMWHNAFISDYFNSGVLLINNESFKNNGIKEKCIKELSENGDLSFPDEQVLNETCKGKVVFLPFTCNFQTWYAATEPLLKATGVTKTSRIIIVHYSLKPWNTMDTPFASLWWKTAKSTPIYPLIEEKYKDKLDKTVKNGYYKYYFSSGIKKFFIKLKNKLFSKKK